MLGPDVPGDRAADLVEVGRFRTGRQAEEQALVLLAVGIGCRLLSDAGRVRLLVAAGEGERAAWELATYERENRVMARTPPVARPAAQGVDAAWPTAPSCSSSSWPTRPAPSPSTGRRPATRRRT